MSAERKATELLETLILRIELFAGTDVRDVAHDLCRLADRTGVLCEAECNGVKLWARPGDNPVRLLDAFGEQLKQPARIIKIAQCR